MKTIRIVTLVVVTALGIAACSTTVKPRLQDGPPRKTIEVNDIPDAVPQVEPLSRYGNPSRYTVFGKTYHVMRSANNYKATGIASWYGTKFHERRTSSGEPYNMFAMTAAHKTLPIPSFVRVTNLNNGRHIIVKVNDRGPFHENRIIDLSYVAAKKLGITKTGTGLVEVDIINPVTYRKQEEETLVAHKTVKPELYLQVGAFSEKNNAERLAKRIADLTHQPVHLMQAEHQHNQIYRVQIGPLADVTVSDNVHTELRKAGLGEALAVVQ